MSKFTCPTWAGAANGSLCLEVYKDGSFLEKIDMSSQKHYTIGRQLKVNDVILDHMSISRQHAAICHSTPTNKSDACTLFDLGSAHGTFKVAPDGTQTKLAPNVPHELRNGDVVVFGVSSRSYKVAGAVAKRKHSRSRSPQRDVRAKGNNWAKPSFAPASGATSFVSAGAAPKSFTSGGVLAPKDLDALSGPSEVPRAAPKNQWETSATESFGADEARKAKFLKLMGGKKGTKSTGYEKRL